jgi:glycerophosphoryl diester phosphodiesterase
LIDPEYQQARLKALFSSLAPGVDFHILALSLDIFELVDFLPGRTLLPVAEYNFRELSKKALGDNYAGISGQYLLISGNTIRKHGRHNQKTGTGFVRSRNCFYRELNRGVEWIFTDHALKLHSFQQELLNQLNRR